MSEAAVRSAATGRPKRRRFATITVALVATISGVVGPSSAASPGPIGTAQATEFPDRLGPPRSIRVIAGGDILPESSVRVAAAAAATGGARFDFGALFAPLRSVTAQADLAICHMELPIARPGATAGILGRSPFGGNLLNAPYELAAGVRSAGFERCSTASNHSYDAGAGGIVSTLDALDASGISHTGTARSPGEAAPRIIDVNGVRVGHVSYTTYSNTARPAQGWLVNTATSSSQVINDVRALRVGGAEVVIVSVHVARELQREPTALDRQFATQITAGADIDVVIQHGPHVIQPMEMVNATPVYWSTGNMISGMGTGGGRYADGRTLDGLLATVLFQEDNGGNWTAFPSAITICTDPVTRVVSPARAALAGPLGERERRELAACLQRTESVYGPTG